MREKILAVMEKNSRIDIKDLAVLLGEWQGIPVTYAGGVGSMEDVLRLRELGKGRLDVTIGSALSLFGGCIPYRDVVYLE